MLTATKTPSSEKSVSPFDKKWLQIEKKQKRNAAAKVKIDKLYQTFQDDVLYEEQRTVELLAQETQHLISFLPRKSFTQWQREELQAWIEDNLSILSEHPFGNRELFAEVGKEYSDFLVKSAQKMNKKHQFSLEEIDFMREMTQQMFNGERDFTEEELIEFLRDPEVFQQTLGEYLAEKSLEDDDFEGDDFDEHFHHDTHGNQQKQYEQNKQEDEKQTKLKSLFNSSKLNKLYKMLANRLHPDKEANEHLKAEKSELMAKLVTAKKNKDAFTIISMFHQFMPESDEILFDGNDEALTQALVFLLNEKLYQLDQEHHENRYHNGIKSIVWQKFNARSKKATQENIDRHLADLEDEHTRLNYYIHEVKTVAILKEILSERYDQRQINSFYESEFSPDDFEQFFR